MVNQLTNPVALAANTLRQVGEQGTSLVQSLTSQLASTSSQLLRGISTGTPGLPGLPSLPGLARTRGNPNGNGAALPGIPGPAAIGQLLQPLATLEAQVLPAGIPGPARTILQATRGAQVTVAENGNGEPTPPAAPKVFTGTEGLNGHGSRRARGVQIS